MTKPAVVIVNHNTRDLLRACLISVIAESPREIFVVDNASTDGSDLIVLKEFAGVMLLRNETNIGYGAAANQAFSCCTAPYILLLNSDTLLQGGALNAITHYLNQNPRVAIVGPRLINSNGLVQASCFPYPTPFDIFMDVSHLAQVVGYIPIVKERYLRSWSHNLSRQVPWVTGAALGIRREAFDAVGGFDETFFMYYEEVDLCKRLEQKVWQIHFVPSAEVIHIGGASTHQNLNDMIVQFYKSLSHFYRRHYSRWDLAQFTFLVKCIAFARLIRDNVLLTTTKDLCQRIRLAGRITAWRRLLIGEWRGQTSPESHSG